MRREMIQTEKDLDALLSEPTTEVISMMGRLDGDVVVLGVAGKMGPTLTRMVKRASDAAGRARRVIGVARFSSGNERVLQTHGIETIQCDLLDEEAVSRLPIAPNVIYMAGKKFGTTGNEPHTWATNTLLPAWVCQRYRHARIVAFSTGNVYGPTLVQDTGSRESDALDPVGEYAMSCVGRERVFEYYNQRFKTPMAIIRLNYACELRYGVLVDLAQRVRDGVPIDLKTGYFNIIWQGDANAMALLALDHTSVPAQVINLTGPEKLSTRTVAETLGRLIGRPPVFLENESERALLSDARRGLSMLGSPRVNAAQMIEWTADWVIRRGATLGKPTHFDSPEGRF